MRDTCQAIYLHYFNFGLIFSFLYRHSAELKMAITWVKFGQFITQAGSTEEELARAIHAYFGKADNGQPRGLSSVAERQMRMARPTTVTRLKALLPKLYKLYLIAYPSDATRSSLTSKLRKVIQEVHGDAHYDVAVNPRYFGLSAEQMAALNAEYKEAVGDKNRDKVQVNTAQLMGRMRELYEATASESALAADLGIWLMLAAGFRPAELFSNEVKLASAENDRNITVGNLAKKRNDDKWFVTVDRPVIEATAGELLRRLGRFRALYSGKEYDVTIRNALNASARKWFPDLTAGNQGASIMRKLYASLAYKLYADPARVNFNSFIQGVLGHNDVGTSFSYSWINLVGDALPQAPQEERKSPASAGAGVVPEFKPIDRKATPEQKIALIKQVFDAYMARGIPIGRAKMQELTGLGARIVDAELKVLKSRSRAPAP